jgi:hypothetical protein
MPRPRPPEKLRTYAVRLTQRQWAKVQELGGAAFLRKLIATHNPARGRSLEHIRWMKARNEAICAHPGTCVEVGKLYHLSASRVSHIRNERKVKHG